MPPSVGADPFTCGHPVESMRYHDSGSSDCGACKRRWFVYTTKSGHRMLLTEPKFPPGRQIAAPTDREDDWDD